MMRRKAISLTTTLASSCSQQDADRFRQATLILQQIAARVDAVNDVQSEAEELSQKADTAEEVKTQKSP